MGWESSDLFRFDLWPLLQGKRRINKLKSAYKSLLISTTGFAISSQPILYKVIMGWDSSDVVTFDLWPPSRPHKGSET